MSKSAILTTRVDSETLELVDRVARSAGRSRAGFAAEAIRRAAEREARFLSLIQEGIDAADAGDLVSEAEMDAFFDELIARQQDRCGS